MIENNEDKLGRIYMKLKLILNTHGHIYIAKGTA